MSTCQPRWKCNSVCYRYNPLKNLKGTNKLWAKLPMHSKSSDPPRRQDFQKHMVSNLKLQVSSPSISVAPQSTLGGHKISSNNADLSLPPVGYQVPKSSSHPHHSNVGVIDTCVHTMLQIEPFECSFDSLLLYAHSANPGCRYHPPPKSRTQALNISPNICMVH